MNRILLLILVAGLAFLVILFANRPDMIEDIWIWIVGLIGAIIKAFQLIAEYFKNLFKEDNPKEDANQRSIGKNSEDQFAGSTVNLLRLTDDGDSTIGNLFVNSNFYCYTMEDTHQEIKIPGKTRIPKGIYTITLRKEITPLTQKYRDANPEWFTYHLEIQNVPGFDSIYIHSGGTHSDTEGCILVSDSLQVKDKNSFLTNSRNTFKRLYLFLTQQLNTGIPVRLIVKDEDWINALNSNS